MNNIDPIGPADDLTAGVSHTAKLLDNAPRWSCCGYAAAHLHGGLGGGCLRVAQVLDGCAPVHGEARIVGNDTDARLECTD